MEIIMMFPSPLEVDRFLYSLTDESKTQQVGCFRPLLR